MAILNEEPEPLARLQPALPAPLRWTIERCLDKSPAERYQSTRDLARELQGMKDHLSEISGGLPAARPSRRRGRLAILGALVGALALAAGLWKGLGGRSPSAPDVDLRRLTFREGVVARALFVPESNSPSSTRPR